MASTERGGPTEAANRIIESVRDSAEPALEAVRRFVDTVDRHFPDVGEEPRRKIIDAAFRMAEQLVKTGTQAAEKIVSATGESFGQPKSNTATKEVASVKRARAKKAATPKKVASRKRATPRS